MAGTRGEDFTGPKITDREQLHLLINEMGLKTGVELGTQQGLYAEYLLRTTDLTLHMVDAWQHIEGYNDIANVPDNLHQRNFESTLLRVTPYQGRFTITRSFSVPAADTFADGSLDFIYVDADHSYWATLADLEAWYPKLRPGGLMAGHDFMDHPNFCGSEFGVKSAVFNFLRDKKYRLYVTPGNFATWWFTKEE